MSDIRSHAAVVATLLEDLAITDAVVVGHSLGGLVAMRLAADRPTLVSRLVLVGGGGVPLDAWRLALIVGAFKVVHPLFGRRETLEAICRRPRLRRLALRPMVANPDAVTAPFALETLPLGASPGFLDALEAGARGVHDVRPEDVTCPTLLLWGREDRVIPLASAHDLLGKLPDAQLTVVDTAGHCPMFEVPEVFNRAVLEFADELSVATDSDPPDVIEAAPRRQWPLAFVHTPTKGSGSEDDDE